MWERRKPRCPAHCPLSRLRERVGVRAVPPLPLAGEGWGEGKRAITPNAFSGHQRIHVGAAQAAMLPPPQTHHPPNTPPHPRIRKLQHCTHSVQPTKSRMRPRKKNMRPRKPDLHPTKSDLRTIKSNMLASK